MSDPMTSAEVEDILSSIRRLVSEETRAEARSETPAEKPKDRLVLTPSLRVEVKSTPSVPDVGLEGAAAFDEKTGPEADAASHPDEDKHVPVESNEQVTAEIEAALEPEDDLQTLETKAAAAKSDPEPEFEADLEATQSAEIFGGVSAFRRAPQSEKLSFGTLRITDTADDNEEQDNKVADFAAPASTHTNVDDEIAEASVESRDEPDSAPVETLSEKIAALETLIARRSEQWEPDDTGSDESAGTDEISVLAWEDADARVEFETETSLEYEQNSAGEDPALDAVFDDDAPSLDAEAPFDAEVELEDDDVDAFSSEDDDDADNLPMEDAIIDEVAMRELIAELVREELQGALGERITRNVRKLVRREIHRALAAQDLE